MEINWSHPRLIIVAQSYAQWDTYAVRRMGDGIELWEYVRYGDDLLYLNQVYGQPRSLPAPPLQPLPTTAAVVPADDVASEVVYTLDYHLGGPGSIRQLFERLREGILALATTEGEIIETPNRLYISYRHGKNFCEVQVMARSLKLYLDIDVSELEDAKQIARDVSKIGHWGTGNSEVKLTSLDEIEYVMGLIEQAYRLTL